MRDVVLDVCWLVIVLVATQFVRLLSDRGIVRHVHERGAWTVDVDACRAVSPHEDVVSVVRHNVGLLSDSAVHMLKCMSCHDGAFSARTVVLGAELPLETALQTVREAAAVRTRRWLCHCAP